MGSATGVVEAIIKLFVVGTSATGIVVVILSLVSDFKGVTCATGSTVGFLAHSNKINEISFSTVDFQRKA